MRIRRIMQIRVWDYDLMGKHDGKHDKKHMEFSGIFSVSN